MRQWQAAAVEGRDGNTPVVAPATLVRERRHRPDRDLYADPNEVDDASQVDPLLGQAVGPVVVPLRAAEVPGDTAESVPTQCDRHIRLVASSDAGHGRARLDRLGAPRSKLR